MPPVSWPSGPDPRLPKAKPPERDWGSAPLGDVVGEGFKRLIPTYASDAWEGAKALAGQLTKTQSPATISNAGEPVSLPLIRSASDAMFGTHSAQPQVSFGQAAQGVGNYVGSRYGSIPALKRTWATDPGSMLMDAQTVATLPEGGGELAAAMRAARGPSLVSEGMTGAANAARRFNAATNPVSITGRALVKGARAGQTAMRGGPVLDAHGNFTPAAMSAVQQAFPNGEVTTADLANPKFKARLVQTLQTKGVNAPAVREAVLAYNGAPTARATVTRTPPPKGVAAPVADAVTEGQQAVARRVQGIVGAAAPDTSAVGAALEKAHAQSLANAGQNFTNLKQIPGSFGPALDGPDLNSHISARLASKEVPSTPELLQRSAGAYPQANAALKLVNDSLVDGKTRLGGEINTPEIAEVRSQITPLLNDATGKDATAVGAIIDGLHDHLESASAAGKFVGPNGPADISGQLRAANAGYKQHFDTFGNRSGPSSVIANAVGSLKGSAKAGLVNDADAQAAAQRGIANALANPTQGPAAYALLKGALGPNSGALDDYVRQASALNPDGTMAKTAKMRSVLNGPTGSVFTPEEQSDLRLAAAAKDVLDAKPALGSTAQNGILGPLGRRAVGAGIGLAGAAAAAPLMPFVHGLPFGNEMLGGLGVAAGGVGEGAFEPYFERLDIKRQMSGAPNVGGAFDLPGSIGAKARDYAGLLPATNAVVKSQPMGPIQVPIPDFPKPPEDDLSALPGPFDAAPARTPEPALFPGKDRWPSSAPPPDMTNAAPAPASDDDLSGAPGPFDAPQARATGGKAGKVGKVEPHIDHLVDRLMAMAKHAKKASNEATKPLLKVPDATITKALSVAQEAI